MKFDKIVSLLDSLRQPIQFLTRLYLPDEVKNISVKLVAKLIILEKVLFWALPTIGPSVKGMRNELIYGF